MEPKLKIFMFGKKKEIKETLIALVGKRNAKEVLISNMPYFKMGSIKPYLLKGVN